MMKKITFLTICLSLFLAGGLFCQETIYVSATGAGLIDGTSEENAYGSFGDAMIDINSEGDKLIIIGTVSTSGANLTSKSFAFTIEGLDASSTLTADGGTGRLFTINGATTADVTLKDLTFSGINTTLAGGAVLFNNNGGAAVTINNCTITGNSVTNNAGGGAIFFANGTLNIIDSSFENNTSSAKGGAIFANSGTISITNTLFKTNSAASKGGAIYTVNGDFAITGSTFYDNQTTGAGGGSAFYVEGSGSSNSITNCTFFQNTTANTNQDYGTIRTDNGNTTVTNSLFYDNKTNNDAGAISDWGSGTNGIQTFTNSIAQWITTNIDNQDEGAGSITGIKGGTGTPADLTNSSLSWDATLNKITYTAPDALTANTPIDFGSDTEDVGAWDSNINIFKGGTVGNVQNWTIDANWSSGVAPIATDNVAILAGMDATLPAKVTVNNIKITSLLKINSDQSLVVTGTASGSGKVRHSRLLDNDPNLANKWYLVASPVSGEIFNETFFDKNDIASNNSNKGIATYNPGLTGAAAWTYVQTGGSLNSAPGVGYSMKITPDAITAGEYADGFVGFEGAINDTDVTTPSLAIGFNLLGNPYTSYVNSGTFLVAASTNIDQTQMWVWNQALPDYEVQLAAASSPFILAPAQGFFVKATSAGAVTFAKSNQATEGGTFQKSTTTEVNLWMTDGSAKRYAKLYYLDNATNGFDSGYEGEVFGGVASTLSVFTDLVADSQGEKYQVQSLPNTDYETTVVAVGVKAEAGKEITFTAEALNLPDGIKVFLEDRLTNTITGLDEANANYKVTVSEAIDGIGRFYLHTKASGVLSTNEVVLDNISIYTPNNTTLRVTGLSQGKATVKLFNILGKQVMQTSFTSTGVRDIALPKLATGMYIVQLETEAGKLNKKIVLE
jgi:predicted outer membrane repeat protein